MTAETCPAPTHTTAWAYRKHGCRCPGAVAANRRRKQAYNRNRQQRRAAERAANPTPRANQNQAAERWAEYQELRDIGFSHEFALRDVGWTQESYEKARQRRLAADAA
jgi:hypothetical protein